MQNRKSFLDEISLKLQCKQPNDWGTVTTHSVRQLGGNTLLKKYKGSLFSCLKSIYTGLKLHRNFTMYQDIEWKKDWFLHIPQKPPIPKSYWNSMENCREYLDSIARNYNLISSEDWRKVTNSLIVKKGGSVFTFSDWIIILGVTSQIWRFYLFHSECCLSFNNLEPKSTCQNRNRNEHNSCKMDRTIITSFTHLVFNGNFVTKEGNHRY